MSLTQAQDGLMRALCAFGAAIQSHLTSELGKVIRRAGLTTREISILAFIGEKGDRTFAEISADEELRKIRGTSASRLSATLSALFKKHKLIEKRLSIEDSRQPVISLTPQGHRLLARLEQVRQEVYEKASAALNFPNNKSRELTDMLRRATPTESK